MCGIAGFLTTRSVACEGVLQRMLDRLVHRGPDDRGTWVDQQSGVALGHTRLAILDLSPSGHQPMQSPSGRYVVVFDGEIYNHGRLRQQLEKEGACFSGTSDTEVMLGLVDRLGVKGALSQLVGMFAFAIWDRLDRTLWLARDRMGEKPLYYGWHGGCLVFGSELKALRAHPDFAPVLNEDVIPWYLRLGYVPSPNSIFRNTYKLRPGEFLCVRELAGKGGEKRYSESIEKYWSVPEVRSAGAVSPEPGSLAGAVDRLEELLTAAVGMQMQADVPVGAFLSGGVDSSVVVALMQKQASRRVRTFSIGFNAAEYDEAGYAKAVAAHLGTEHTELYLSGRDALDVIPALPAVYDEPLGDSSQLPTYVLARLARGSVKVSLSGDGADELFCGYPKYMFGDRLCALPLRRLLGLMMQCAPDALLEYVGRKANGRYRLLARPGGRELLGSVLSAPNWNALAWELASLDHGRRAASELASVPRRLEPTTCARFSEFASTLDLLSYLPDDVLTKLDRAAMAVGLETRAPFLDKDVVEFALTLPLCFKMGPAGGKAVVREVLYRHVPRSLVDRPKKGFAIPLTQWLRGDLRDWAESLLSSPNAACLDDSGRISRSWRRMLEGDDSPVYALWAVLMLLAWQDQHL